MVPRIKKSQRQISCNLVKGHPRFLHDYAPDFYPDNPHAGFRGGWPTLFPAGSRRHRMVSMDPCETAGLAERQCMIPPLPFDLLDNRIFSIHY